MTSPVLIIHPPGSLLATYNRHASPSAQVSSDVPPLFLDAMSIREAVFCHEQAIALENEYDDDDARSFHWVIYSHPPDPTASTVASVPGANGSKPVPTGTIRLVPPPHPTDSTAHGSEPYVKLGRLAVLPRFRKGGYAKPLLSAALEFAEQNPEQFGTGWKGLVLVHAQEGLEGYYVKWGFKKDSGMGRWDEEGIMHVGMWKRVEVGG